MTLYKCRMCENDIDFSEEQSIGICGHCGTSQSLPVSVSDKVISAMNRANHLRQQCEFNKASAVYEELLKRNESDPEIYWQLVLCRYGVKYTSTPQIDIMIPDCRRARYRSVLCDPFFLKAMKTDDLSRRDSYRKEAEYIDVMQKKLLIHVAQQYADKTNPDEADFSAEELIRQGNLFLAKRKWAAADAYFTQAINTAPQSPEGYLGKLLVECELDSAEKITDVEYDLSFSDNYKTALRLGCAELETLSKHSMLNRGIKLMESAESLSDLSAARELISQARGCEGAEAMLNECSARTESLKEENYQKACRLAEESSSIEEAEKARNIFTELENYKDSPLKVQECNELLLHNDFDRENAYRKAAAILAAAEFHSDFDSAADIFSSLDDYKDSPVLLKKCLRKRRFLSFSAVIKLGFIAGICYAVPIIIDKI